MFKNRGKGGLDSLDNENVLQAVVIVDTFSQKLSPFCDYMPSSLIPLANRPLLEYTLDCLFSSGVQEVILFCSSYADQIRDFIRDEKWPGLVITVVVSEGCRTLGDVMRDLDTKALIRSDFVLLTGNVVGNLQLLPALERHKRFQKVDKSAVMTLVLKECGRRWKTAEDDFTVALDTRTSRVLLYSKKSKNPRKVEIPMELVLERPETDLRCDLLDTQVCICSIAVPPLFSDNFDFQTKDDFVRGLLADEEIMAGTIYCYLTPPGEYAACVTNWAHYRDITHDVINRWVYPQVPDMFSDEPYSFRRHNIYTQRDVSLSQVCSLEGDLVIASGTSVGHNSTVSQSVIGKNCKIGNNVVIESSYIMDNVTVHDCCRVSHAVVGPGSTVHTGAVVSDGSVLGMGVVIDEGQRISNLILQGYPPDEDAEPEKDKVCSKAYLFKSSTDDDSDSDSETNEVITVQRVTENEDDKDWDESSDSDDEVTRSLSPMPEDTNLFYSEVVDSLVRGYEDRLHCDNLVLEINSSRYAYNVTMSEVNFHVVRALLTLPGPDGRTWQQLASRLMYFMPIFTNYIRSDYAQKDCLLAIEDVAGNHEEIFDVLVKLIHWLYDQEVLPEEAILHWYHNPSPDADSTTSKRVRKQVESFIRWLEEAEEQSGSDSDSD